MRLAIVRASAYAPSETHYNMQEAGLAKALMEFGVSTDIFTAGTGRNIKETVVKEDAFSSVRAYHLPYLRLPGNQIFFPSIFGLLRSGRYDVIQAHEYPMVTTCLVSALGALVRTPVVVCQGLYRDYAGTMPFLFQSLYDAVCLPVLCRTATMSIAKTHKAAEYFRRKGMKNILVCPVGLDDDQLENAGMQKGREELGLPEDAKVLLYVGVIERRRNVDFIIKLFNELARERGDMFLLIAGDGPEAAACKKIAGGLRLQDRVIFAGKVPQKKMYSIYGAADIFLLPSSYEIYGMAILEAMYFGLPVVSTRTAGAEEIIENGTSGVLMDGLDFEKWLFSLRRLIADEEKRNIIGANARERVRERFLWRSAARRYYEAYRSAIEQAEAKGRKRAEIG